MKPPYSISKQVLMLIASISELIGEVHATHLSKPPTELRKRNKIKTIQSSLEIEGNTLTEEQITALLNNERVLASQKDILEVQNAIALYERIREFDPNKLTDVQRAHKVLMQGLIDKPGSLRATNVGVVNGSKVAHVAPSGSMVKPLMNDLLSYLKTDTDLILIKSCVFHYEFEFIHPFLDGNGRMGRFWQTIILMQQYPVFEYLPIEALIKQRQDEYYKVLSLSDKLGHSTPFVEFMLGLMHQALKELLLTQNRTLSTEDRILLFKELQVAQEAFSRKDYLLNFKEISSATASRDLKWAVEEQILIKTGDKRLTRYKFKK